MSRVLIFSLTVLFFCSCKREDAISDSQTSHFVKFIGNSGADFGNDLLQTSDGGYMVVGTIETYENGSDIFVSKLNKFGDIQWTKTFGGSLNDLGNSIGATSDGGFIIAGSIETVSDTTDIVVYKLDAIGNQEWVNYYGKPEYIDEGIVVKQTSDGGYIIGANTTDPTFTANNIANKYNTLLIKTNSTGVVSWNSGFGSFMDDKITDVVERGSGGYILIGVTSNFSQFPGDFSKNIFLVKTNTTGSEVDTYTYGNQGVDDQGSSIERLPDNNYLISGAIQEPGKIGSNIFLAKIGGGNDNIRTADFKLSYSSKNGIGNQFAYDAKYSSDNSYIVTGKVQTNVSGFDQILIKVNTNGSVVWDRVFGGEQDDVNQSVIFTENSGYAMVGSSYSGVNSIVTITKVNIDGELK